MRSFVFCCVLACSAPDGTAPVVSTTTVAPVADDSGEAIARAKVCLADNGYKTVWGSTVQLDRIRAVHIEARRWVVDVPESGYDDAGKVVMLGLPSGIAISVDLDAKACRQLIQE